MPSYSRHSWKIADGYVVLSIRTEGPLPSETYEQIGIVAAACELLAIDLGWHAPEGGEQP